MHYFESFMVYALQMEASSCIKLSLRMGGCVLGVMILIAVYKVPNLL